MNKNTDERDPRTYVIIGAAMEVHKELGSGFLEAVYQEVLAIELSKRDISFRREIALPLRYKGEILSTSYRADYICFESVVVELKAISRLSGKEESQIMNYLKATGLTTGLLLNFGSESLEYKRFIFNPKSGDEHL